MPRPLSPGVLEVELFFTFDGQQVENVFHWFSGIPWTETMANGLVDWVIEWWTTNLQSQVPTTVVLQSARGTDLSSLTGLQVIRTTGLPAAGTAATAALPNNSTVAVKWSTALRGRSYRGRTFHIGLPEAGVTGNALVSAYQAALLNAYQNLTDDPGIVELTQMCVLSEVSGGAPRAEGICTTITAASIEPIVDSQRRRLPGRGR